MRGAAAWLGEAALTGTPQPVTVRTLFEPRHHPGPYRDGAAPPIPAGAERRCLAPPGITAAPPRRPGTAAGCRGGYEVTGTGSPGTAAWRRGGCELTSTGSGSPSPREHGRLGWRPAAGHTVRLVAEELHPCSEPRREPGRAGCAGAEPARHGLCPPLQPAGKGRGGRGGKKEEKGVKGGEGKRGNRKREGEGKGKGEGGKGKGGGRESEKEGRGRGCVSGTQHPLSQHSTRDCLTFTENRERRSETVTAAVIAGCYITAFFLEMENETAPSVSSVSGKSKNPTQIKKGKTQQCSFNYFKFSSLMKNFA